MFGIGALSGMPGWSSQDMMPVAFLALQGSPAHAPRSIETANVSSLRYSVALFRFNVPTVPRGLS